MARLFYNRYMETRADPKLRERTGLPPIEQIREQGRQRALQSLTSAAARDRLEKARQSFGESPKLWNESSFF